VTRAIEIIKKRLIEPVGRGEMVHSVHVLAIGVDTESIREIGLIDLLKALGEDAWLNENTYVYCFDAATAGSRGIGLSQKDNLLFLTGPVAHATLETERITAYPVREFFQKLTKDLGCPSGNGESGFPEETARRESEIRKDTSDLARMGIMCDEALEFFEKIAKENNGITICFNATRDALIELKKNIEGLLPYKHVVVKGCAFPFEKDMEAVLSKAVHSFYPEIKLSPNIFVP